MEEILRFLNAEQTIRNKALMYIWRILMAILTTNLIMNYQGYCINYDKISLSEAIHFLFSFKFLFVLPIYLILVFFFFWFLHFACMWIGASIASKYTQYTDADFDRIYLRFLTRNANNELQFVNRQGVANIRAVFRDPNIPNRIPLIDFTIERANVLVSTEVFLVSLGITMAVVPVFEINVIVIFGIIFIIHTTITVVVLSALYKYVKDFALSQNLNLWIINTARRGYAVN